ncbi:hypothetical protein HaLaN_08463, partial [Haematococcus lacustris]
MLSTDEEQLPPGLKEWQVHRHGRSGRALEPTDKLQGIPAGIAQQLNVQQQEDALHVIFLAALGCATPMPPP